MLDVKPTDQRGAALEAFARWLPIDMLTSNCHRRGGGLIVSTRDTLYDERWSLQCKDGYRWVLFQVSSGDWALGDLLCDTWIACDVMSCTASILNLTAISVDRSVFTARCTVVQSAVLRSHVVCPSVHL